MSRNFHSLKNKENEELIRALNAEKELLIGELRPFGILFKSFVKEGYYENDRGLSHLNDILDYLFQPSGVYSSLQELTDILTKHIPAMKQEKEFIEVLDDKIITPILETQEEANKRGVLFPEEFVSVAANLASFRTYLDYRLGFNFLRRGEINNQFNYFVNLYKRPLEAFLRKKVDSEENFYMGPEEEWAYIAFFVIDAHDNSVIYERKRGSKNVLWNYIPRKGLEEILVNNTEKVAVKFRELTRYRKIEKICLPNFLTLASEPQKVKNYYKKIYGEEQQVYII